MNGIVALNPAPNFCRAMSPFNTFLYRVDNYHQEQAGRFQQNMLAPFLPLLMVV